MAIRAAITGVHGFVPDYVLTNEILEKMVDTNDQWIVERTGIKERRILNIPGEGSSYLGMHAVKGLLEKTNTDPSEVDLVICATVTPDMIFPDNANVISDRVGIKNAFGFDIHAACSGFIYGLTVAARFIESGKHKKIVFIGADKMSSIVDYSDRSNCILFGDAAAAVLLEPTEEEVGVIDSVLKSDGAGRVNLYQKAGGSQYPASLETVMAKEHYIYQNGKAVFKVASESMAETIKTVIARNGLTSDDIAWVAPHQANRRIIEKVAELAKFPLDRVMINIHKYGNTTAATIPLCLWEWENQLRKGDNVILTAFGGGYTWGAVLVKWAYDGAK